MTEVSTKSGLWHELVVAPWSRLARQPAFLICLLLLGISAG